MSRKIAMAFAANLAMFAGVFANSGPPPLPKNHKVAEPPVRFEGTDEYADHVFYLRYHETAWKGPGMTGGLATYDSLVEVKDSTVIKLKFKSKETSPAVNMWLLAMERKAFDKRKNKDTSLKWLPGFADAKSDLILLKTTAPIDVKEIPVTTYRVTLRDGKLSVETVEDKKSGEAGATGLLPSWMFGIVISMSLAWFGIWFARRDDARRTQNADAEGERRRRADKGDAACYK